MLLETYVQHFFVWLAKGPYTAQPLACQVYLISSTIFLVCKIAMDLHEAQLVFAPGGGPEKIVAVSYKCKTVHSEDLFGTMLQMDFHCSRRAYRKFTDWLTQGGFPDLRKAAKFQAILFLTKYEPQDEWEMETEEEWDAAVLDLLQKVTERWGLQNSQPSQPSQPSSS